ncbi:response regulator [Halarcobacter sp.]|uniref:response regulator n=1 Tax=Halarcobacter sp. TaxID=2321133 RepID=UPI0029F5B417|nr:response regulator [Halarcobacter sp.]
MSGTIDKKLLKRLKLLYVEDDDTVRADLSSLLSNFFDTVYTAKDGQEGLSLYKQKQNEIDVIVADINMPGLTGIQMLAKIREFDKDVPTIFATAYSDNEFLVDAIKLKVSEYIIKPIDIRNLMTSLNEIAKNTYHDFLINQQNKELKKYKDIIYNNNIVIRTNKHMKISFVNDLFCKITGFDKKELLGEELTVLKHKDVDSEIYKKIYNCVLDNRQWNGELKNLTKDGSFYYADTSVISTLDDSGDITGCLIIQKDETSKAIKRREIQTSLIKDKSEIFQKSKKSSVELYQVINNLNDELESLKEGLQKEKQEKNSYINTLERYSSENKKLLNEINTYRKVSETSHDATRKLIKMSKESADLKVEIKRLETKLEMIEDEHQKDLKQQKVYYEVKLDDMDKLLTSAKEKLDAVENVEAVSQKLAYWQEKAKSEAKKNEKIEKEIISYGDKKLMAKLFGGK